MLENSIYSVISPEGCASILWRDPSKSLEAAEAMKLTAKDLLNLNIIDELIEEPIGGAHRDVETTVLEVKNSIIKNLQFFENLSKEEIYDHRKQKFLKIGRDKGFVKSSNLSDKNLGYKETISQIIKRSFNEFKFIYLGILIVCLASLIAIFK
jgi:acetyl-CoA carboxylase carboxyl transferase subunit alpha